MNTTAIRQAAATYLRNRDAQSKGVVWDKSKDQAALFKAMRNAGLTGVHAMAGTHLGTKPNGKLMVVEIGDNGVEINTYKDSDHWMKAITRKVRKPFFPPSAERVSMPFIPYDMQGTSFAEI